MPADNKRFGEIGVKVITRTSARPLTVIDNPNGVQSIPNFAKLPGRCYLQATNERHRRQPAEKLKYSKKDVSLHKL